MPDAAKRQLGIVATKRVNNGLVHLQERIHMKPSIMFTIITMCAVFCVHGDTVTFSDGAFNLGNYSDVATFKTNPADTVSFNQCPSCGNPGQALQVIVTLSSFSDLAGVALINNTFSYNPQTQGPIASIDASVDKNEINNLSPTTTGTTFFIPLIEQNGLFYLDLLSGGTIHGGTNPYKTIAGTGLVASDFDEVNFATGVISNAHPNFAGSQMLFGLESAVGLGPSTITNVSAEDHFDNLKLSIHNSVPESGATSFLLFGSIVVLLVFQRTFFHGGSARRNSDYSCG
jgi:hypothetical protein